MKKIWKKVLLKLGILRVCKVEDTNWLALKNTFFEPKGWLKSSEMRSSVDRNGSPIPWLTYPSISFLGKKLKKI